MENSNDKKKQVVRDFRLTTFALNNRTTVMLLTGLLILFGLLAYKSMPLELFPEVNMPWVFVNTIYPGNAPLDIENLITRPLEKEINTVTGIKKLTSTSSQDSSMVFVEFNTNVEIGKALLDVKDAVDRAKGELPNDLDLDPMVFELDFNEFPIININLSGDFSIEELKGYAEYLQDDLETIPEVSRVDIKGINDREIQINVDPAKLEAYEMTFDDIANAVDYENMSIAGGEIVVDRTRRAVRTVGEFEKARDLGDVIVKQEDGEGIVYLKDVATVVDGFAEAKSYARLDRHSVVSLQVVKKARENLVVAVDKIREKLALSRTEKALPDNLTVTITNDNSEYVRSMVSDLENNIIMGVIFVVGVLFLFLGLRNALFVGLAIPMSMFISFIILSILGTTVNMMVLFGLVLALGMLVDNGIVVIENIHRFIQQGHSFYEAARQGVGEIAWPIITSTLTTLAAFSPLIFWTGIMGEFMKYLPITLIVSLSSSLFVALVINPVLAVRFIKREEEISKTPRKKALKIASILFGTGLLFLFAGINTLFSLLLLAAILVLLHHFFLYDLSLWFQNRVLVKLENSYLKTLNWALEGRRPRWIIIGMVGMLIFSVMFFGMRGSKVLFFPDNEPSFINIFAELPVGTDIAATNEFMHSFETRVFDQLSPYKSIIKSVLTTVGEGVVGENEINAGGTTPHKGMLTISFVDTLLRGEASTSAIMKQLSDDLVHRYPGVVVQVVKNEMGPPTGKPVNLEISGKDFDALAVLTQDIQRHLVKANVPGLEGLKMDLDLGSPELVITLDRDAARRFGMSTAQIASTIRTSLFGKEVSKLKDGEDEYPIVVRFAEAYRNQINVLLNQKITFRSQINGKIMQVPISAVARIEYGNTYNKVNRLDLKRVITLWSNVIQGYNPNEIIAQLKDRMAEYKMPEGFTYKFTGQQQEQDETSAFLMQAMLIALAMITLILVTQFNSFVKPMIIMFTVVLSTIGVFLGLGAFKMEFVILMTGIGIISLAGVVVNNAIVLVDYINYLKDNAKRRLGLEQSDELPVDETRACVIEAGRTRLRPVLLTAITTILGLIPMAIGFNLNFATLFSRFDPQIFFGGDNAQFWGPMAWTVIFGLTFATVLTLVMIPSLYFVGNRLKTNWIMRRVAKE
jgi:multidrug efflux pump subunit AcrB